MYQNKPASDSSFFFLCKRKISIASESFIIIGPKKKKKMKLRANFVEALHQYGPLESWSLSHFVYKNTFFIPLVTCTVQCKFNARFNVLSLSIQFRCIFYAIIPTVLPSLSTDRSIVFLGYSNNY